MRWMMTMLVLVLLSGWLWADPKPVPSPNYQVVYNQIESFRVDEPLQFKSKSMEFIRTHPQSKYSRFLLRELYVDFKDDSSLHALAKEIVVKPEHRAGRIALHYLAFYNVEGWRKLAENIIKTQPESPVGSLALCRLATVDDSSWKALANWVLAQSSHHAKKVAQSRVSRAKVCEGALTEVNDLLESDDFKEGAD